MDAEIAGQNGRAVAVPLVNDFVEHTGEVALGQNGRGGVVSDFVQDQQVGPAVLLPPVFKGVIGKGGQQALTEVTAVLTITLWMRRALPPMAGLPTGSVASCR